MIVERSYRSALVVNTADSFVTVGQCIQLLESFAAAAHTRIEMQQVLNKLGPFAAQVAAVEEEVVEEAEAEASRRLPVPE